MVRRVNFPLTVHAATRLLAEAMEEINAQRKKSERIDVTPATILVGAGTGLDSLLLLNFLVAAEVRLADDHGIHVGLIDLVAEGDEDANPLESIATLTEHLVAISKASNGSNGPDAS